MKNEKKKEMREKWFLLISIREKRREKGGQRENIQNDKVYLIRAIHMGKTNKT